ncbi:MAG TPA: 6-bladed beta-propeller [bacterium]|nr:6-bladed beta-propeller [bacterium]HPN45500.1 6-bladed beta-propeller [bacterium]
MKRLLLITCLLFITGLMNNVFAATVKTVDGVTYIHNTETPKFSEPTIELKEEWRIGGEDPGFIFNSPSCIDVDEDGRILVVDILEKDIKIFSPTGKFEKKFGRKGNGPGEFMFNFPIVSLAKEKLLVIDSGIAQPYNRFNYFAYDGTFFRNEDILLGTWSPVKGKDKYEDYKITSAETRMVYDARLVDGNLWLRVHYTNYTDKERCRAIFLYDLQNKASRQVYVFSQKNPYLNEDMMQKIDDRMQTEIVWCENKNNTITVIPDLYDYRVYIYNNSGSLLNVLSRDFTLPLKSKNQYGRDLHNAQATIELYKNKKKINFNVLKNNSIIKNDYDNTRGLFYDNEERLWVLTNESFTGKRKNVNENIDFFSAFDIFDSHGEYLMRMPIKTHIRADNFKYKNGFLYFFDIDDAGFKWLVKIRVVDRIK